MTVIDYLLLGGLLAGVLYTGYRLFLGWLRTPHHEMEMEPMTEAQGSRVDPPVHTGSTARGLRQTTD